MTILATPVTVPEPASRARIVTASAASAGWDPFEIWRTRVRDPRRALRGVPRR